MISHLDLGVLGVYPRHAFGLIGILTSPLIHENLKHLFANTIPLFVLGSTLFYFYKEISFRVFFIIYFLTGLAVWAGAREAYHIGASGVIYGLASFLFFSGIFRKAVNLLAITMLVTFLYGSMVWGIFPELFPEQNISWESHFWGLVIGLILAFYYRKQGPQRKIYEWENEDTDNDKENILDNSGTAQNGVEIKYHIKKNNPE
ncbi:MAG: rhomboid family intramembrane serine protease [Bacteroidales bacterium]|nr:rhomboid family intramembrane serine protease [Bacteroidales bacterium]